MILIIMIIVIVVIIIIIIMIIKRYSRSPGRGGVAAPRRGVSGGSGAVRGRSLQVPLLDLNLCKNDTIRERH